MEYAKPFTLAAAAVATGPQTTVRKPSGLMSYQAVGQTSSGTGAAAIAIEVSNDGSAWLTLGTISLSLSTTAATDGFLSSESWVYVRANITALTGTGASVTVTLAG